DDALALGVKHAAINVNLSQLLDPRGGDRPESPRWTCQGQEYFFNAGYINRLDADIRALSSRVVIVYLIILAYESGDEEIDRLLLHQGYDRQAPNHLGAFNTRTPEGRRCFTAMLEFLAERWSRPDQAYGRASGYIIGN